jgi:hypothetical protein
MKQLFIILVLYFVPLYSFSQRTYFDHGFAESYNLDYSFIGGKWNKTHLKYYINNSSNHLTPTVRENAIKTALQRWAAVSHFTFEQVYSASNADLKYKWATGDHGDGNSFDGAGTQGGNVLAHAFMPPSGEVHFDDYENWIASADSTSSFPNLVCTALHETGHALGLSHSTNSYTVMEDLYNGMVWPAPDDVEGIWALYGCPFSISGDDYIYQSSTYTITNFPSISGLSVVWTLSDSYYNQNCLQFSGGNQCTITRNNSHNMYDGKLTAKVYYGTHHIFSLTRTVNAYQGFRGYYYNGVSTTTVYGSSPLRALPNTTVNLKSINLVGATVTYTGNPSSWFFYPSEGRLYIGMPSTVNTSIPVHVEYSYGGGINLTFVTAYSVSSISATLHNGLLNVSLVFDGDENNIIPTLSSDASKISTSIGEAWVLEVYNATTGEKVFSQEVDGTNYIIDTTGWKPGVYVVRAVIGDEVLNEKVIVN